MSMVFCRACGKEIHESAPTCPHCGASQGSVSASERGGVPDGIKGWSWGAFLLNWVWAIGNRTWIGLLAIIPYVGFIMAIVLGFKGREWAWKNKEWESVEQFNRVQKKWSYWGVVIVIGFVFIGGILAAIAIPAYKDYVERARQAETSVAPDPVTEQGTAADQQPTESAMPADGAICEFAGTVSDQSYDAARKNLILFGWQPKQTLIDSQSDMPDEVSFGNGAVFWKRGYKEIEGCGGTGEAPCSFLFSNKRGDILRVTTAGEEGDDYHAMVRSSECINN